MKRLSFFLTALLLVSSLELMAQVNFTVCTYNVKSFEIENQELSGGKSFQMQFFYDAFRDLNADIYCINELEILTSRMDQRNLLTDLAAELGMYSAFGKSYDKDVGLYGNGLISRFPILSVHSKLLPKPAGSADQRSVMWADILHPSGQIFRVVVTHLDHIGGAEDQLRTIAKDESITKTDHPIILMGDMNMGEGQVNYILQDNFKCMAFNWVDYIGVASKNGTFTASGRRVESFNRLSDHAAVLTQLTYSK